MLPCAVLCGGFATRLRPITEKIPKSLIPINGEPFITYQLHLLHSKGITHAVLCVGYLGEMIQEFVGDGRRFGMDISYSFDGTSLLGTAGAIRKALPLLGTAFFALYGDSYLTCDYQAVAGVFRASCCRGLMTIYRNEGRFDASNVEARDGRIVHYDKTNRTPGMMHIDYGLGVFSESAFGELPVDQVRDLAQVYQNLAAGSDLASYEVKDRFYEIGSEQGIQDLTVHLQEQPRESAGLSL